MCYTTILIIQVVLVHVIQVSTYLSNSQTLGVSSVAVSWVNNLVGSLNPCRPAALINPIQGSNPACFKCYTGSLKKWVQRVVLTQKARVAALSPLHSNPCAALSIQHSINTKGSADTIQSTCCILTMDMLYP